jgi:hypothetical protein
MFSIQKRLKLMKINYKQFKCYININFVLLSKLLIESNLFQSMKVDMHLILTKMFVIYLNSLNK